jgi:hypothetical protein
MYSIQEPLHFSAYLLHFWESDTVNCMLKFLMFQGLPNSNIVTSFAEARMPRVQLTIAPTCRHKFSKLNLLYIETFI